VKRVWSWLLLGLVIGALSASLVPLASGVAGDSAAHAAPTSERVGLRTLVLQPGDELYVPLLDLGCALYPKAGASGGPLLDCGRVSTNYRGLRVEVARRKAELSRWSQALGWRSVASAARNP
jgi:hypothetical protein